MRLQYNKVENLRLAIARIDGIRLAPGEVFSYWYLIGNPTARKGYLPGMILFNGQVLEGTGGGLCQLSNLIYWMTLHSPLAVRERWRHSFDVFPDVERSQPFGSGATCAYNYIDLQIANETTAAFQLRLWLDDTHLHGEWRSDDAPTHRYEVVETDHEIRTEWWGAYSRHNTISHHEYDLETGDLRRTVFIANNDALMMYSPLLEAS